MGKDYIHYNTYGGVRGFESAINSFDKIHDINYPPYAHYNLRGWHVDPRYPIWDTDEYGVPNKVTIKITNNSEGWYTARPWKVSVGRTADGKEIFEKYNPTLPVPAYKVIPKTKINVFSIPAMRLVSRSITPRDNGVAGLSMQDVDVVEIGRGNTSPWSNTKRNNNTWAINKIKNRYSKDKGITSLYRGDHRVYPKKGVKPIIDYDATNMRSKFLENAKEAIIEFVREELSKKNKSVKVKRIN